MDSILEIYLDSIKKTRALRKNAKQIIATAFFRGKDFVNQPLGKCIENVHYLGRSSQRKWSSNPYDRTDSASKRAFPVDDASGRKRSQHRNEGLYDWKLYEYLRGKDYPLYNVFESKISNFKINGNGKLTPRKILRKDTDRAGPRKPEGLLLSAQREGLLAAGAVGSPGGQQEPIQQDIRLGHPESQRGRRLPGDVGEHGVSDAPGPVASAEQARPRNDVPSDGVFPLGVPEPAATVRHRRRPVLPLSGQLALPADIRWQEQLGLHDHGGRQGRLTSTWSRPSIRRRTSTFSSSRRTTSTTPSSRSGRSGPATCAWFTGRSRCASSRTSSWRTCAISRRVTTAT